MAISSHDHCAFDTRSLSSFDIDLLIPEHPGLRELDIEVPQRRVDHPSAWLATVTAIAWKMRTEVERIERDESALLDALLQARQAAGLTQSQVAARMGTQAPAVARLERALASGRHSPSIATLRKYVKACGKRLVLRVA